MQEKIQNTLSKIKGEKKEKFDLFRNLLIEYNEKYNLTTILGEEEMLYKHFLDSGVGSFLIEENANVAEIGSGAGFPSIPLKILRDDLSFSLFESVGKKCDFLKVVVDKLQLKKMNIYTLRAEDAARREEFREKFDIVTARAVARMNTLSEYCLPFVKKGGAFIAYKGNEEEIDEAKNACKILGGKIENVFTYELPNGYGERRLAVVKKVASTPAKYPRGQGKERKNPL
ncbi:MAG: 16S rRNA (guanine(527)-N(7))-methyltransferase RsmG [Clostridia bacterium]|nr:16S rRNA (guanine(527)-N(7))-methyltransferase RsmG [Clostridia bacterium]